MKSRLVKQCGGRGVCVPMIDGVACVLARGKALGAPLRPGAAAGRRDAAPLCPSLPSLAPLAPPQPPSRRRA